MSQPVDLASASDDEIRMRCHSSGQLLSDPGLSNKVVRISPDLVVKFGRWVERGEFLNQKVAFERLDSTIVLVPKPHRFIEHESIGYLVMDFAKGEVPTVQQALDRAPQLARIFSYMHTLQGEGPRSLGGDAIKGTMWPSDNLIFNDRKDLERWLTIRARLPDHRVTFGDQPLVMCHMDFTPRNMVLYNGTVTLLDWASSGYFPRLFDYISHYFSPLDTGFYVILRRHLDVLTYQEEMAARDVGLALNNCLIYYFPPSPPREEDKRDRTRRPKRKRKTAIATNTVAPSAPPDIQASL